MGEGQLQIARDNLFDVGLLIFTAQIGDQTTGQHSRIKKRLHHTRAAPSSSNTTAMSNPLPPKPPCSSVKQRADDAQFGQLRPDVSGHATVTLEDFIPRGRIIAVPQETTQAVLQHLPLFCQI